MEYQPGVCNIGPAQQRRRLLLGVVSLLAAGLLVAAIVVLEWPQWALAFVGAAMGVLQYRERFCVGFAGIGVFDVGAGTTDVTDPQALAADRTRAVRLNAIALGIGVAGTLLVALVVTQLG